MVAIISEMIHTASLVHDDIIGTRFGTVSQESSFLLITVLIKIITGLMSFTSLFIKAKSCMRRISRTIFLYFL